MKVILVILLVIVGIPIVLITVTVGSCSYKMAQGERESASYVSQVRVGKWEWYRDGEHVRFKGNVKNWGDKPIRYFKIDILFHDASGNVVDTCYTNSAETLMPGWSKNWDTMHRFDQRIKSASVEVTEVALK